MHASISLRSKWRSLAVALVTVVILSVLTAGIALAQGHVANDGQTLEIQSPEVQQLYTSVWGDNAAMQWAADHNAAIGQVAPQAQHPRYDDVFHVAYMRSMDMELAGRITADVIARGTIDQFMAGTDMGVLYGYVAPAPQPRAAPSTSTSTSTSTSSGPSTPTSPSTSTVSDWGDITRYYVLGQTVSLTLPSTSHADFERYLLDNAMTLMDDIGLTFDASKRQITGTVTWDTAPDAALVGEYSAQTGALVDIGEPYILTLTINVRDADLQPDFRSETIASMTFVENRALGVDDPDMVLPEVVYSGNPQVEYSVSLLPMGVSFTAASRTLSGTPTTPGSHQITYTAEDEDGDTASLMFTITVEADTEPAAPSIGNRTYTLGQVIGWILPEGSGGNGALTYDLMGEEGLGLTFLPGTRYVSGTVAVADLAGGVDSLTFALTYIVTEMEDATDKDMTTFTITVNAAE